MDGSKRVVVVTGASSGIGALVAARMASQGHRVIGTSRSGGGAHGGIEMLALDVDRDASVAAFASAVLMSTDRVDVLVNNAGRAMVGAGQETSADEARALFETNVFGVMRVTSAFLPAMRARGAGAIVNVGSISGLVGLPFHGTYSASKHALAGYTEALRAEVRPFGVRVALVEPEAHRTGIAMTHPSAPLAVYDRGRTSVERVIRGQIERGGDPRRVADAIVRAALARAPAFRTAIGPKAWLATWARRLLPSAWFEAYVRHELQLAR
jgi:short-subunit dehydrogenase